MPNKPEMKKPDIKVMKRLLSYITADYKPQLAAVLLCIVVNALAGVLVSVFIKSLIDDYIAPLLLLSNPVFTGLFKAIMMVAAVCLAGVVASLFQNIIMVTITQGVQKKIRDDMFAHMQELPVRYFDTNPFGDVMSRYTNDTDTLRQMISQSIPQVLSSLITIVAVFCAMLWLSVWLTVLVLLWMGVMLLVTQRVAGKSRKFFGLQQKSVGDLNGYIEELINGQKVVKVFCYEEDAKRIFDGKNEELRGNANIANRYGNIMGPIMNNLSHFQYVILAIAGGALALYGVGGLTIGSIAAFLTLSRSFSMPVSNLSQQVSSIVMAIAGAERIFKLMDEKNETDEGYVTLVNAKKENGKLVESVTRTGLWAWKHPHTTDGSVTYTELMGDMQLVDVDFAYEENKPVLHDVSLFAKPGEMIAFVGATGAGKTTITNLINRFYDIEDGKIRYDGININKIKKDDLRRSLAVVLQDTNLFTGNIRENIRYGRLDATDAEVIEAAKLANAHDFIMRLPEGYDTVISGDGSQLSQGQRQLLSIARAAAANPPVMILDEATSSIDTRTEKIVQDGMTRLMNGRTVFVIAHRLSTVQNARAIMVLEHGRIIERGDHASLIAQKGKYYQLYTGAFELE